MADIGAELRKILDDHGRLATASTALGDDDDLYRVGLSSHAAVNVMLAVEDAFDIEFPEHLLQKSTFQSLAALRRAVEQLCAGPA